MLLISLWICLIRCLIMEEEMATHPNILAWKNPMDREAWLATVHRIAKSWA